MSVLHLMSSQCGWLLEKMIGYIYRRERCKLVNSNIDAGAELDVCTHIATGLFAGSVDDFLGVRFAMVCSE